MDWLILLLLVPAILVPLVFLCGFAGCSIQFAGPCKNSLDCTPSMVCVDGSCVEPGFPRTPSAPQGLTATAVSAGAIALSWDSDLEATDHQIERAEEGDDREAFVVIPRPFDQTPTSATDRGLPAGVTFFYQIRAINEQGTSEPSDSASATTLSLQPSFQPVLLDPFVVLDSNERRRGDCIVQRIGAGRLLIGGTQVRITLQGPDIDSLTLLTVTISHADTTAGADPFDSDALPTVVAQNLVIPAGANVTTQPVAFNLDNSRPLLIAFDVSGQIGQDRVSFGALVDAETKAFRRNNAADAATQDRSGFAAFDRVYLIRQIEVL